MTHKKRGYIDLSGMSIQAKRQYLAKFESYEAAQNRVAKRNMLMRKSGVLPSNATISSAYGALQWVKENTKQRKNNQEIKPLHIVSIPMGGMN